MQQHNEKTVSWWSFVIGLRFIFVLVMIISCVLKNGIFSATCRILFHMFHTPCRHEKFVVRFSCMSCVDNSRSFGPLSLMSPSVMVWLLLACYAIGHIVFAAWIQNANKIVLCLNLLLMHKCVC